MCNEKEVEGVLHSLHRPFVLFKFLHESVRIIVDEDFFKAYCHTLQNDSQRGTGGSGIHSDSFSAAFFLFDQSDCRIYKCQYSHGICYVSEKQFFVFDKSINKSLLFYFFTRRCTAVYKKVQ